MTDMPLDPDDDYGKPILSGESAEDALEIVKQAAPDMTPEEQAEWARKLRGGR